METMKMDLLHNYTVEEVSGFDEHAELIDGKLVVTDKTTVSHNIAVSEIATSIKNFIQENKGDCKVFTENVALYICDLCDDDKNFFLPDVMSVCENDGIREDGVHATPLFVAEVTSEATRTYDYNEKLTVYKKIGVKEYWVVDLQRNAVYKYLESENYIPQTFVYPESMKVTVYPGLLIDLSEVMRA